jgi:hypothetical protein
MLGRKRSEDGSSNLPAQAKMLGGPYLKNILEDRPEPIIPATHEANTWAKTQESI